MPRINRPTTPIAGAAYDKMLAEWEMPSEDVLRKWRELNISMAVYKEMTEPYITFQQEMILSAIETYEKATTDAQKKSARARLRKLRTSIGEWTK